VRTTRLRTRLVAAFVGTAALTTLVAALLTAWGLNRSFDGYLERRTAEAGRSAQAAAQSAYRSEGDRWTPTSLDLLSHELLLTGYDFRLVAREKVLLDTTKLESGGAGFRQVGSLPVIADGDRVGTLQLYALDRRGSTSADGALRRELDRGHIIAAVIAAIVAVLAGLIVAGRLSRPLRQLTTAARGLAHGGRVPLPLPGGSSEMRELAESLDGLADDLERQRRARRQLAEDLSHELRTPLMLLQSRIEAMQDGIVPFDPEGLALLHTETLRLGRLVGQIERLAEAEAQPAPLHLQEMPLDEIAREVHAALASAFETRGIALALEDSPVVAYADRDAVMQIATNLLTNALKYAPENQPVRLITDMHGEMARMSVVDQGAIPGVERSRVFERFYRGSARDAGGTGLGLTIARSLAEAQGGRLEVKARDSGTSFELTLRTGPRSSPKRPRPPSQPHKRPQLEKESPSPAAHRPE
jgi:two-component system sensor histidine kinase BaeS